MKIYALLTGRGNNTLKDKNVLDVLGHPVLFYPARAVANSKYITHKFCSSDDKKILDAAAKESHLPILRPAELALPTSQHIDCILHALSEIKKNFDLPEILVVTLANNVTIKSEWIDQCIELMMADESLTAAVPVYLDNDHHPLRAKSIDSDGYLHMYEKNIKGAVSTNRQDLPKCYFLAHNFWVLRVKALLNPINGQAPWTFMGDRIKPFVIEESIDIHEEQDLFLAQNWIKKNYTDF